MNKRTKTVHARGWTWLWMLALCALLAACASPRRVPAPVEDRGSARPATVGVATQPAGGHTPSGAENAGKLVLVN